MPQHDKYMVINLQNLDAGNFGRLGEKIVKTLSGF